MHNQYQNINRNHHQHQEDTKIEYNKFTKHNQYLKSNKYTKSKKYRKHNK
jgi:hypothetical protein